MTLITADPQSWRPPRPASVTVAFWLQIGAAVLVLAMVGVLVAHAVYYDDQISRAVALVPGADPTEVSDERSSNLFGAQIPGVVLLLVAGWLLATAVPLLRGRNIARILVFVGAGAHLLLCAGPCLAGLAIIPFAIGGVSDPGIGDVPVDGDVWEQSRFYDTLYSATTSSDDAFFGSLAIGTGLEVLLVIAIVLLVALPPAHRYFVPRPPTPAWPVGYPPVGAQHHVPWPQPYPGLPYVICPDPSAHVPPAESDPAAPV
jgi:hypothetical protein